MRILFIRSNPVNPDSRVEKEANALVEAGYDVSIFAWDRDNNYKIKEEKVDIFDNQCNIFRVGIKSKFGVGFKKNIIPLLKFQNAIRFHLKKNKYDIIHACDFDTGLISFLYKKSSKFVYDVFDYYIDSYSVPCCLKSIISRLEDYICNNCDLLILCTDKRKKQIRGLTQKNIAVIHNSPVNYDIKDYGIDFSNKMKIVYVGILANSRMVKELVKFVENHNEFELHIGGFGVLEEFVKNKSHSNDNIIYYGKIPYSKTLYIEQECDILTGIYDPKIPNHFYAAPNKFYESLFLGKPIIMAKNTGMSEVVLEKGTGVVIDFSYEELEKSLLNIKCNICEWKNKEQYIKSIYNNLYSWNQMKKILVDSYQKISEEM